MDGRCGGNDRYYFERNRMMILIVGGAYQGKENFARQLFPEVEWVDGKTCALDEIFLKKGILHLQAYIRRAMREEKDLSDLAEKILASSEVVVTDEIGYGIVPIDAFEREYREKTGRICTELAYGACKVYRVICGIGTVIKE